MGTNCAPLVADLFLFCYERDFMMSLSDDKQADIIDAFNTTSRYLDDILNINNVYFDTMVMQIYLTELQLSKANTSDTKAAFLDLHLSISNDIVSTKIYDKRDDYDFEIVNSHLNINNVYFDTMVMQIYLTELQLSKANTSDTKAAFLDLHLSISNDIVSTKIYDKRDDYDFEIVNFPFLDGDVPRSTSYGVYISQLIRFARVSSHVADFNARNKWLTQKLLKQRLLVSQK